MHTELQARVAEDPPDAKLIAMLSTLALGVLLVACGKRRGPAGQPRARPRPRDGAAPRDRCRTRPARPPADYREPARGHCRRRARSGRRLRGHDVVPAGRDPQDFRSRLGFNSTVARCCRVSRRPWPAPLIFGLVPAIQSSRADLIAMMKAGDGVAPGRRRRWGRAPLSPARWRSRRPARHGDVHVSGFRTSSTAGPGYRIDHLFMMGFDTNSFAIPTAQSQQFIEDVADHARTLPGVRG